METTTIISCKNLGCKQKIRIPVSEKRLQIRCPVCGNIFSYPDAIKETEPTPDEKCFAYIDIETTSLNPYDGDLTVIGLCLEDGSEHIVQLVGNEISSSKLIEIMKKVKVLYTYNGTRFDLPFIKAKLGVDLTKYCIHKDLMYECWSRNLYGGLKEVERKLGIKRKLTGIDGKKAAELGLRYTLHGDKKALSTLLEYNKEDVLNLRVLEQKLNKRR